MTTERPASSARGVFARVCFGLSFGALLLGCAGTPRVAADLENEVPPELREDYLSFTTNCSKCHELDRPLQAHIDEPRYWDVYVAKMMRTAGSAISARESPKILRFLYWYTERKNRLASERSKAKETPVVPAKAPAPAAPPPPVVPPVTPSSGGTSEQSDPNAVNPAPAAAPVHAPTQVNQGEGAP